MDDKTISLLASVTGYLAWAVLAAGEAAVLVAAWGRLMYEGGPIGFYDILLLVLAAGLVAAVFFILRYMARTLKSMTGPAA